MNEEYILENIFSIDHLMKCAKSCCNGVRWKSSTQNFEAYIIPNVFQLQDDVLNQKFKSKGFHTFTLRERGKERRIQAVHISERAIQKTLCEYCLLPIFTKTFIYDNGACLKGKGMQFSLKRINTHLHKFYLENGNSGYVLKFDIQKFFESINHKKLIEFVSKKIEDERVLRLYSYFVNCFEGETGLGLGSQISQVSASIYLNQFDHYIKDTLKIKYYGRYMDDGYIFCKTKEEAEDLLEKLRIKLAEVDLHFNEKKTMIIKLSNGFTILKRRYYLYENGKIVKKPYKKNILRYKKKYKKLLKQNLDKDKLKELTNSFLNYLNEFNYYDRYTRRIEECIA